MADNLGKYLVQGTNVAECSSLTGPKVRGQVGCWWCISDQLLDGKVERDE